MSDRQVVVGNMTDSERKFFQKCMFDCENKCLRLTDDLTTYCGEDKAAARNKRLFNWANRNPVDPETFMRLYVVFPSPLAPNERVGRNRVFSDQA